MAKAGFAGSLVVDANWKGRNLNRGMRDSKKRVNNFGKSIRRMVGAVALGAGAYVGAKGLISLLKMSKAGSEAWSRWLIAWTSLKSKVAELVAGPAVELLDWASSLTSEFTNYIAQFETISQLVDDLAGKDINSSMDTWLKPFVDTTITLLGTWKEIKDTITSGVGLATSTFTGYAPGLYGRGYSMLDEGRRQLSQTNSQHPYPW